MLVLVHLSTWQWWIIMFIVFSTWVSDSRNGTGRQKLTIQKLWQARVAACVLIIVLDVAPLFSR
jgi:hypothetical protein